MGLRQRIVLPEDSDQAAIVIRRNCDRMDSLLTMWRLNVQIATHYAAGYRSFNQINPETGEVVARFTDAEDDRHIHPLGEGNYLFEVQQIMGFLGSMNTSPTAKSENNKTLDAIRQQGAANAILGSIYRNQNYDEVMTELDYNYAHLGFGCLHVGVEEHIAMGLYTELEAVHPFEVMPFPYLRPGFTAADGVTRRRLLTRDSLVAVYGESIIKKVEATRKHSFYTIPLGDSLDLDLSGTALSNYGQVYNFTGDAPQKDTVDAFEVSETWIYGPMGTVERMLVTCGDVAIEDRDFEGTETYCPLVYRRCYENGTFWGAGHFVMAFGAHRRAELLRKSLFKSLINQDKWPIVVLPQGQVNERTALGKLGGSGLRYMKVGYDLGIDRPVSPIVVSPVGTSPGTAQMAEYLEATSRSVNPVPDLSQDKGRVDSAQGLQYLDQEAKRPITSILRGKKQLLGAAGRVMAQRAVAALQENPRRIPVPKLSLDLVGTVIDPETMEIEFTVNPLPNIGRLSFSIMEGQPSSGVGAKMEGLQLVAGQLQSLEAFQLFCVENDIDLALDLKPIRQAYNNAVLNILLLYNDGQTSQQALINTNSVRAEIELLVLNPFLSSREFLGASVDVQEALLMYQQILRNQMNILLPPVPETAAVPQA
jgi:hypothetical protein